MKTGSELVKEIISSVVDPKKITNYAVFYYGTLSGGQSGIGFFWAGDGIVCEQRVEGAILLGKEVDDPHWEGHKKVEHWGESHGIDITDEIGSNYAQGYRREKGLRTRADVARNLHKIVEDFELEQELAKRFGGIKGKMFGKPKLEDLLVVFAIGYMNGTYCGTDHDWGTFLAPRRPVNEFCEDCETSFNKVLTPQVTYSVETPVAKFEFPQMRNQQVRRETINFKETEWPYRFDLKEIDLTTGDRHDWAAWRGNIAVDQLQTVLNSTQHMFEQTAAINAALIARLPELVELGNFYLQLSGQLEQKGKIKAA